ncbi:MAG TPA: IPT/TIG domain-containing protein [Chloroflexota bacterium]|nr:IPT/TIG domain-containing protein [Chloroflexota bacterium]
MKIHRGLAWTSLAAAIGLLWTGLAPSGAFASATPLTVSQATGFAVLGHWCGGIQEHVYSLGFAQRTGYPVGEVYLWTTCSTGKGGPGHTYSAWISTTWDLTATLVTYRTLTTTAKYNPTLSVYDVHHNHLYNQANQAYLALAKGFVPAPRVAGLSPSSAPQGSTITITGTAFSGATAVYFGSKAARRFTVNGDTTITAVAPAVRSGTVNVTVTSPRGKSFTNSSDRFTFVLTPRVAGLRPNQGTVDGGTSVTITGVNFTGATAVSFGGLAAKYKVKSDTSIVAVSPPGLDSGVTAYVTVTSRYGTSATGTTTQFTWLD